MQPVLTAYHACPVFPNEVADYYSLQSFEACSALSLLVGPHANHPRCRLVEALETMPHHMLREEAELEHAVGVYVESVLTARSVVEKDLEHFASEIAAIDAEVEALQRRRASLVSQRIQERQAAVERADASFGRSSELIKVANKYLDAIRRLKPYYEEGLSSYGSASASAEAKAAGMGEVPRASMQCSLQELARTEAALRRDVGAVNEATNLARQQLQSLLAESKADPSREAAAIPPQPRRPSPERATGAYTPPTAPLEMPPAATHSGSFARGDTPISATRSPMRQPAVGSAPSSGPNTPAMAPLPPSSQPAMTSTLPASGAASLLPVSPSKTRPTYDRDTLLYHVLTNEEQQLFPMSGSRGGPVATGSSGAAVPMAQANESIPADDTSSIPHRSSASTAAPSAVDVPNLTNPSADEQDLLQQVLRAKATRVPNTSSSEDDEMEGYASTTAADTSYAHDTSATGVSLSAPTSAGSGVTATTVDPLNTVKLAARLVKQYKRVRQCLRDAAAQKQKKLVRSLLRTVGELRKEAQGYHIDDVEAAIRTDPEMMDLLEE